MGGVGFTSTLRRLCTACVIGTVGLASGWQVAAQDAGPSAMTGTEMTALVMAVTRCWNVGSLPEDAFAVTVTVRVMLDREGKPVPDSIKMEAFEGGTAEAAQVAFVAAKRAIIRCGTEGYDLPPAKYETWKDLSIVFDTQAMDVRQ